MVDRPHGVALHSIQGTRRGHAHAYAFSFSLLRFEVAEARRLPESREDVQVESPLGWAVPNRRILAAERCESTSRRSVRARKGRAELRTSDDPRTVRVLRSATGTVARVTAMNARTSCEAAERAGLELVRIPAGSFLMGSPGRRVGGQVRAVQRTPTTRRVRELARRLSVREIRAPSPIRARAPRRSRRALWRVGAPPCDHRAGP